MPGNPVLCQKSADPKRERFRRIRIRHGRGLRRSVPKVGRPEIATLKLRSASGGVSKTSPADADRFSAEYATETQPSPDAQVVGVPRVGGLHHRYVWREAA